MLAAKHARSVTHPCIRDIIIYITCRPKKEFPYRTSDNWFRNLISLDKIFRINYVQTNLESELKACSKCELENVAQKLETLETYR